MELLLKKNELLDLGTKLKGSGIICRSGCCWLTIAGDNRDYILRAGNCFSIKMSGQLLVTATENCRLQLVAATRQPSNALWQPAPCNHP